MPATGRQPTNLCSLDWERYSYTSTDVIGNNRYVGGTTGPGSHVNPKEGHKAGYQVNTGDYFQDISALLDHQKLPPMPAKWQICRILFLKAAGYHRCYQSEGAFLTAAIQH